MNALQRQRLQDVKGMIQTLITIVEEIHTEQDEKVNRLGDKLIWTEKGQSIEESLDKLINVLDSLTEAIEHIDSLTTS